MKKRPLDAQGSGQVAEGSFCAAAQFLSSSLTVITNFTAPFLSLRFDRQVKHEQEGSFPRHPACRLRDEDIAFSLFLLVLLFFLLKKVRFKKV